MLVNAVEFFQGPVTTLPEIVTRNPVWTRIAPNAFAMDGAVATIVLPATTVLSGAAMFDSWMWTPVNVSPARSEEHTSELQSRLHLVCRLLLEKKKKKTIQI